MYSFGNKSVMPACGSNRRDAKLRFPEPKCFSLTFDCFIMHLCNPWTRWHNFGRSPCNAVIKRKSLPVIEARFYGKYDSIVSLACWPKSMSKTSTPVQNKLHSWAISFSLYMCFLVYLLNQTALGNLVFSFYVLFSFFIILLYYIKSHFTQ